MQKWRMPEACGQEACVPWPPRAVALLPVLSALAFLAFLANSARLAHFANTYPHSCHQGHNCARHASPMSLTSERPTWNRQDDPRFLTQSGDVIWQNPRHTCSAKIVGLTCPSINNTMIVAGCRRMTKGSAMRQQRPSLPN